MARTPQDFIKAYEAALLKNVTENPDQYFGWKPAPGQTKADLVPRNAAAMIRGLRDNTATISPTVKAVAEEFGIKPTRRDIRAFLNS